jgi:hypothetical protein
MKVIGRDMTRRPNLGCSLSHYEGIIYIAVLLQSILVYKELL